MDSHYLTVGAHLLLWAFPLVLVAIAVAVHLVQARHHGEAP